ncbi:hypothetical protein DMENIID0001_166190 [Sergentomyia squamirostris]
MGRPRKNATGQSKEVTPKAKVKEPEEEVENLPLTLTRSRRTPKPNPKYLSDVIVPLSAKVTGESSRESSVARSDTSEDTVPASEEDEEEEMDKVAPKKRGRPRKYPLSATPSTPVVEKKPTPQTKPPEKKELPGKRIPERLVKKTTPEVTVVKRKRDTVTPEEDLVRVDLAKKRKAVEEKPAARTPPQQIKVVEKKVVVAPVKSTPSSPAKGDVVGVAGTKEMVKIVDVSDILNKKHDDILTFGESKNKRKCPPEAPKTSKPPPLYTSKILSQTLKGASSKAATPVTPKIAPKVYSKIAPSTIPQISRQPNNNGKLNSSVSRFSDFKKLAPARSAPVIDLTKSPRSSDTMEKPKRALKDALLASTTTKKTTPVVSRAAASAVLRSSGLVQKTPKLVPIKGSNLTRITSPVKQKAAVQLPKLTPVAVPKKKREITTIEMWTVVQLPPENKSLSKVKLDITPKELIDHLADIRLPSDAWSHTEESDTVIFERATDTDAEKKDRIVTFKGKDLTIRIEDSEITLIAAPDSLTTPAEIQTLLQIVNDVNLKNACVEEVTVVL